VAGESSNPKYGYIVGDVAKGVLIHMDTNNDNKLSVEELVAGFNHGPVWTTANATALINDHDKTPFDGMLTLCPSGSCYASDSSNLLTTEDLGDETAPLKQLITDDPASMVPPMYYESVQGAGGNFGTTCLSCPAGQYSEDYNHIETLGNTVCKLCEAGRHTPSADATFCTDCPSGKYHPTQAAECISCDKGQFNEFPRVDSNHPDWNGTVLYNTACFDCPAGKYQDKVGFNKAHPLDSAYKISACHDCHKGRHSQSIAREYVCERCEQGRYQPTKGEESCIECAKGKHGQPGVLGGIGEDNLQTYTAYHGHDANHTNTTTHESNQVTLSGSCTSCAVGHYRLQAGSVSCVECEIGKFVNETGWFNDCYECSPGEWQDLKFQTSCYDCAVGKFGAPGVTRATSESHCSACPKGKYQKDEGTTTCTNCTAGYYMDDVQSDGESWNGWDAAGFGCKDCPDGKYQPNAEAHSCMHCAVGKKGKIQPNKGDSVQEVGYSAATSESDHCDQCQPGFFQNETAQTFCHHCVKGKYQPGYEQTSCIYCVAGQYQPGIQNTTCIECDKGQYGAQNTEGAFLESHCSDCQPGEWQNLTGQVSCFECYRGRFAADTQRKVKCVNCPTGQYQPERANTTCIACATGKYGMANSTITHTEDVDADDVARYGTTTGHDSESYCQRCEVGRWQNVTAQISCNYCAEGTYQPTREMTSCIQCQSGQYQPDKEKTTCIDCNPGTHHPHGRLGATAHNEHCDVCPNGKYQDGVGKLVCKTCGSGTYSNDFLPQYNDQWSDYHITDRKIFVGVPNVVNNGETGYPAEHVPMQCAGSDTNCTVALQGVFQSYGAIEEVGIVPGADAGKNPIAFVLFDSASSATQALAATSLKLEGKDLKPAFQASHDVCHDCKTEPTQLSTAEFAVLNQTGNADRRQWWTEENDNNGTGWNRCTKRPLNCARRAFLPHDNGVTQCSKSCRSNIYRTQHEDSKSNEQSQLDQLGVVLRDPLEKKWDTKTWVNKGEPGDNYNVATHWSPYGYWQRTANPYWTAWGGLEADELPGDAGATAGAQRSGHIPTLCSDAKFLSHFGQGGKLDFNGDHDPACYDMWGEPEGRDLSDGTACGVPDSDSPIPTLTVPTESGSGQYNYEHPVRDPVTKALTGVKENNSYPYATEFDSRDETYLYSSITWTATVDANATLGDMGYWTWTEQCNRQRCPIDCVVSPWTTFNTCSSGGNVTKCGTGTTTRTRTIVQAPNFGGKVCPNLAHTQDCNTHACLDAVCHAKHVRCKLNYVSYAHPNKGSINGEETDDAKNDNARPSTCKNQRCVFTGVTGSEKIVEYDAGDYPSLTLANENGNGNSNGTENVYKAQTCPLDLAPTVMSSVSNAPMRTDGLARSDQTNHFNCHRCDTEFECMQKQINRVIEIIHDKRFSHIGYTKAEASRFKCKIVDGKQVSGAELNALHSAYWLQSGKPDSSSGVGVRPSSEVDYHTTVDNFRFRTSNKHELTQSKCECRCTHHPTGCFRKNWRFAGDFRNGGDASFREGTQKYIEGNIYDDIADKEECSNLCSHHPECKLWEFIHYKDDSNANAGKCILRSKSAAQVEYVQNDDDSIITYAGVTSHNSASCLFHDRPTLCPYGKYVWTEQSTEKKYCLKCEAGKYTRNGSNNDQCYSKAELESSMGTGASTGHGVFVYPDETTAYVNAENGVHEDNYGTSAAGGNNASYADDAAPAALTATNRFDAGAFTQTPYAGHESADSI
jgi:hypothetical protein